MRLFVESLVPALLICVTLLHAEKCAAAEEKARSNIQLAGKTDPWHPNMQKEEPKRMPMILKSIEKLEPLVAKLSQCQTPSEKLDLLSKEEAVVLFLQSKPLLKTIWPRLAAEDQVVLAAILVVDQGERAFCKLDESQESLTALQEFLKQLREVEDFYTPVGGIVGYHYIVLKLIAAECRQTSSPTSSTIRYLKPEGLDLMTDQADVRRYTLAGLEHLENMAEIYPVGGAGDRLMLRDEQNDTLLPAACLMFGGRTLLEGLIRDLQAREYLYFKLYQKQLITPVAMMTSEEKNNDALIRAICEEKQWFGRSSNSFVFFMQPLAPVLTKEGEWGFLAPMKLLLKPGGHGVIWKLAQDRGVFDWFAEQGRHKAIVRQINNPVAGIDNGLLTLFGLGCTEQKSFGFASCERLIGTAEGMNVLIENSNSKGFDYCISNVEYTEFAKKGISDVPVSEGSSYSVFPTNTNILFVDIPSIRQAVKNHPLPGVLVNMKNRATVLDHHNDLVEIPVGRLESTMQNIADFLTDHFPTRLPQNETRHLQTFLTYNHRGKTISVTKKAYVPGQNMVETPEGCFYDVLQNHHDLLTNYCHFELPSMPTPEEYLQKGPSFLLHYHPALGPLYSIIAQKIRKGTFAPGSEMQLEITELDVEDLHLQGSLLILADSPLGHQNADDLLSYSHQSGKCELHNVHIINQGIDFQTHTCFWKNQPPRKESLTIHLHGNGEFFAQDVTFHGSYEIHVPHGTRTIASQDGNSVKFRTEKIPKPTWHWLYKETPDSHILLNKGVSPP